MFTNIFKNLFNRATNSNKSKLPKGRHLQLEYLEARELLSVNPLTFAAESLVSTYDEALPQAASDAPAISLQSGVLSINGTSGDDWIEIEANASSVIVHSGQTALTAIGTYTRNQITNIIFYGNAGNDTFKNSYNGVINSIDCSLYGGDGNDYLLGGDGNDILDGGSGDNMFIGGLGQNTYITGTGSNLFALTSIEDANQFSQKQCDNDDAVLYFSNADRNGISDHTFNGIPYHTRVWTTQEVISVLNSVQKGYEGIGTYKYFRDPFSSNGMTYLTLFDYNSNIWMAGMNSYLVNGAGTSIVFNGSGSAGSANTLLHEFGHNWDGGRGSDQNPFWNDFRSISWDTNGNRLSNAVRADFPSGYAYGDDGHGGSPHEDWADTVANVLTNYTPNGASSKYLQKVEVVKNFLQWLDNQDSSQKTITVTTTADVVNASDGVTSLREAVQEAKSGDKIVFADALKGKTITIDASDNRNGILINKDLTVDATGQDISITPIMSYTADSYLSKYAIRNTAVTTILGLTFTGMDGYGCYSDFIDNTGDLSFISCQIVGNASFHYLSNDGNGTITLTNSLVAGNTETFNNRIHPETAGNWGMGNYGGGQLIFNNSTVLTHIVTYPEAGNQIIINNSIADLYFSNTYFDVGDYPLVIDIHSSLVNINSSSDFHQINYGSDSTVASWSNPIDFKFKDYTRDTYITYAERDNWKSFDFHLGADSPAINAGNNSLLPSNITKDLAGNARIQNGTVDIGAYETQTPPAVPVNFKSIGNTKTTAFFSWASSNEATRYELQYKKNSDGNWSSLIVTSLQATVTGLSENTLYDFRIRANNTVGNSGWTSTINVDTSNIIIPVPSNLRLTQSAQTTLTLDWNDVTGTTGYVLQRKTGSGDFVTIYTGTDSQYVDRGLTENASYSYRVQAVGSAFSTEISAKTTAKIVSGKEVTDSPVVLSTVTSNGKTTVTWTNLGSDYRYLVYKDAQLVVNLGSATSYIDSNPAGTTTYSVYAYNDRLKKWSWATPSVVTATAPKIEITGHEILPNGNIRLTWNSVGTNYMVYQSGFPASGSSYLKTTDWTDTKPLADNQYQIYASYIDPTDNKTKWTWSNIYFVTKPAAAPAASSLDAFWAEYNNSVVDDDVLNGIVY